MIKFYECNNCEYLQVETEFGECAECGYEELIEITEEAYKKKQNKVAPEKHLKIKFNWEDYLNGNMGGFNKKIAEAFSVADLENRAKLKNVYPEIYNKYMEWLKG